ncbi:hypothetical protein C8R44DRAFT_782993 [Mycena epipterygia]|nr:hypothetical protein C8R44DRAFT_782993 [Mycena epipterygia]
MGTRGYRVYRHKGWYHVRYNHWDSYPDGLGVEVASEVPTGDAKAYKAWLDNLRKILDSDFEKNKHAIESDNIDYFITRKQPRTNIMIEWVYEIDLDHEVFLVDSNPLFALNNMPDPANGSFVECIGVDSYGHRSYSPSTPEEHRYNWKSAPPNVDDNVIEDFTARQPNPDHSALSVTELLGTTSYDIGSCEAARIEFFELLIGKMMGAWHVGHDIRLLEALPDRTHISSTLVSLGVGMVQAAVGRMIFGNELEPFSPIAKGSVEFSWLAPDICLRITTHLDDERNMKKATLDIVDEVALHREPGSVTYGILFSFFHCIIIKVDPNNGFKSTATLQFLPSFRTTTPSTSGITAIARLAYHCLTAVKRDGAVNTLPSNHFLSQVPLDVVDHIAGNLDPLDLESLRLVAPLFQPAADALLCYPYIKKYRLLNVVQRVPETSQKRKTRNPLTSKVFFAVIEGSFIPALVIGAHGSSSFVISVGEKSGKVNYAVLV